MIRDPYIRLRKSVVPDHAIQKAVLIDTLSCKQEVLYDFNSFSLMYYVYLMCIVFGMQAWRERYRMLLARYKVADDRVKSNGMYIYVRLADGREYLTKREFNSTCLDDYKIPNTRYLCVHIDSNNITPYYKRFLSSWTHLEMTALDFVITAFYFDQRLRHLLSPLSHKVSTIDDDTFEEKNYFDSDYIIF
jgi:hypothetical protein